MRTFILSLLTTILFALPLKAEKESVFWSSIPQNIKTRYQRALNEATLQWALDYADSLDVISKEKGKEQLGYFAQHIRSNNAYFLGDSLRFITLIDECIELSKKYDFVNQYLCNYLNKSNFYIYTQDFTKAQQVAYVLVDESQKTNDDSNLYYGYFALGSIFAETLEYQRSNDYFELALATFKGEKYSKIAKSQVLGMISKNFFYLRDYQTSIEYADLALETDDSDVSYLAIKALAYYHLGDYESFNHWADEFLSYESYDDIQDYFRICVKIAQNIIKKNYAAIPLLKDSTSIGNLYMTELLIDAYKNKGEWDTAFKQQNKLFSVVDSIRRSTFSEELAQKDLQLSSIQTVREQERRLTRQKYLIIIAMLIIFLIVVVVCLIIRQMRQNIQAKQRELEVSNRFRTMIENAPFQFNRSRLIYDDKHEVVDYRTIDANNILKESFQKVNLDLGKQTIKEAYPESAASIIAAINSALKAKKNYTRFQYHMSDYDQYYELIIMFDGTDIIQIFSVNTTELVRARNSLKEANKQLYLAKERAERSDRAKTTFLQNMSHEIRTPLNAIMGFSQLLSLPDGFNTPEEKAEYAEYVSSSSSMLTMLIDDILDISDADRGNYKVDISEVSANLICRLALKTVEYRTPPGVKMYFTSEVDDDYLIETDPRRVQQVIINYLTNACKHTKEGEIHMHLSISENPGKVTFSVTDTGTGVPVDMAEAIFERFTKIDAFVQGTGLGLNICSIIAEKLGGKVMLDTSYTNGARFLFIL